jgi:hypothetical protein
MSTISGNRSDPKRKKMQKGVRPFWQIKLKRGQTPSGLELVINEVYEHNIWQSV